MLVTFACVASPFRMRHTSILIIDNALDSLDFELECVPTMVAIVTVCSRDRPLLGRRHDGGLAGLGELELVVGEI